MVRISVGSGRVVVGDLDGLYVHGEGGFAVVSRATGPLDGAFTIARVATSPDANLDTHGCLGEVGATNRIAIRERPGGLAVDKPADSLRRPDNLVRVGSRLRALDLGIGRPVVGGGVTLAKVVGLDVSGITAKPFLRRS